MNHASSFGILLKESPRKPTNKTNKGSKITHCLIHYTKRVLVITSSSRNSYFELKIQSKAARKESLWKASDTEEKNTTTTFTGKRNKKKLARLLNVLNKIEGIYITTKLAIRQLFKNSNKTKLWY